FSRVRRRIEARLHFVQPALQLFDPFEQDALALAHIRRWRPHARSSADPGSDIRRRSRSRGWRGILRKSRFGKRDQYETAQSDEPHNLVPTWFHRALLLIA